jgi:hypothetical protein
MAGTRRNVVPGTVVDDILAVFHGSDVTPGRPDNRIPFNQITDMVHHDIHSVFSPQA